MAINKEDIKKRIQATTGKTKFTSAMKKSAVAATESWKWLWQKQVNPKYEVQPGKDKAELKKVKYEDIVKDKKERLVGKIVRTQSPLVGLIAGGLFIGGPLGLVAGYLGGKLLRKVPKLLHDLNENRKQAGGTFASIKNVVTQPIKGFTKGFFKLAGKVTGFTEGYQKAAGLSV